jgi:hypothetical protein
MCIHLSSRDFKAKVRAREGGDLHRADFRDDLQLQKTIKTLMTENQELKGALRQRERMLTNSGIPTFDNSQLSSISPQSTNYRPPSSEQDRDNRPQFSEEIVSEASGSGGGSGRMVDVGKKRRPEFGDPGVHPAMSTQEAEREDRESSGGSVCVSQTSLQQKPA